jgi:hypothetical protein
MQNLCLGTECTVSGYRSCEASILLHWTQLMFVSVSDHFANLQQVKDAKLVFGDWMHCFRVLKFWSFHSTPLDTIDVCECFGSFRWPSTGKRWKLVFGDWMHCFRVLKLWSIHSTALDTIDVCECFGSFLLPSTGKRCKTCVWGLNALFQGTEILKLPFYSIGLNWYLWVFQIISLTFNR